MENIEQMKNEFDSLKNEILNTLLLSKDNIHTAEVFDSKQEREVEEGSHSKVTDELIKKVDNSKLSETEKKELIDLISRES